MGENRFFVIFLPKERCNNNDGGSITCTPTPFRFDVIHSKMKSATKWMNRGCLSTAFKSHTEQVQKQVQRVSYLRRRINQCHLCLMTERSEKKHMP